MELLIYGTAGMIIAMLIVKGYRQAGRRRANGVSRANGVRPSVFENPPGRPDFGPRFS